MSSELGIYQVTLTSPDRKLDYVPVDILIKAMIIAGWKDWKEKTENLQIYNAAGVLSPSFGAMSMAKCEEIVPPINAIMYHGPKFTSCKYYAWIVRVVEMIIPAIIIDGLLVWSGEKAK
jgi:fatty acyl-CoA reductase